MSYLIAGFIPFTMLLVSFLLKRKNHLLLDKILFRKVSEATIVIVFTIFLVLIADVCWYILKKGIFSDVFTDFIRSNDILAIVYLLFIISVFGYYVLKIAHDVLQLIRFNVELGFEKYLPAYTIIMAFDYFFNATAIMAVVNTVSFGEWTLLITFEVYMVFVALWLIARDHILKWDRVEGSENTISQHVLDLKPIILDSKQISRIQSVIIGLIIVVVYCYLRQTSSIITAGAFTYTVSVYSYLILSAFSPKNNGVMV